MFCNKPKNVNRNVPAKRNRKRRKKTTHPQDNKKPRQLVQNNSNLALAMSSWAETYTAAATWQLKHQIAYWKSRAKALEYENKVLHDVIRKNYFKNSVPQASNVAESSDSSEEVEEESEEDNDEVEVSEEFIEFLKKNAKYKEDARRERERYKASTEENGEECIEEEIVENSEEKIARFKELYGSNWEKIMALETSVLCDFIHEKDKERPQYWPNIPFNFDY